MLGRSVTALLKLSGALVALKYLADLARDGQIALAIAAVMIPISIVILVRARGPAKTTAPLACPIGEHGPAVFRQLAKPDQVRIASLAASGNAIGAIMALRKLVKIDLRTAKNVVDQLAVPTDD